MATTTTETFNLEFGCPRCGHIARDEYETLDAFKPTDWRCDRCERFFNVLLLDCQHCGTETTSVALSAAEQCSPQKVVCLSCQRPVVDDEETEDDLF